MDDIVQEHDQVREALSPEVTAPHLLSRIIEWEQQSIEAIKDTAKQARIDLQASLDHTKKRLGNSLDNMAEQLKSSQASNVYTEKELDEWLGQLKQLQQLLEKPVNIEIVEDDAMRASIRMIKVIENFDTEITPTSNDIPMQSSAPPVTLSLGK